MLIADSRRKLEFLAYLSGIETYYISCILMTDTAWFLAYLSGIETLVLY